MRIADIIKNPEMTQAMINKTLIALVAAKQCGQDEQQCKWHRDE